MSPRNLFRKAADYFPALRFEFKAWTVPVALFLVALFSYGVFIPWFGLYGDDWIYLYAYHIGGPLFYIDFVGWDRPFSAWIYLLITPIFGENVVLYHIFLFVLRWLGAVLVWWVLRMIWRKHEWQVAGVALLLLIFPGFRQQPIPLQFMLHLSSFIMFLLSLGFMLLSIRDRHRFWIYTVLSLLTSAWAMFPIEYFVGLEGLRPIMIWMMLSQVESPPRQWKQRLWLTIKRWIPYLVLGLFFVFWRVFIFKFPSYQPVDLARPPFEVASTIGMRILTDLYTALLGSWGLVFNFPAMNISGLRYYGLAIISIILVGLYLFRLKGHERAGDSGSLSVREHWGVQAFWIGLIGMVVAGPPFWVAGVPMYLTFPWDRTSLAFMLGSCLMMMALIEMVIHARFRTIVLAALIGLGMGSQYLNAKLFYSEWQRMSSFFWQLSWRAPALKPGTLIIYDNLKMNLVSDNDLTPLLNWMYAPERRSTDLLYKFFDLNIRYQKQYIGLDELKEDVAVDHINRSMGYSGNTSNAIVVTNSSTACMRLLKPGDENLPNLSETLIQAIRISHPDQVIHDNTPAKPPFMGSEPAHDWCFYFQKAELASAQQDWQRVIDLGNEAFTRNLKSVDKTEYLPFIEAYARTGEWEKAAHLSREAGEADVAFRPAICDFWNQLLQDQSLTEGEMEEVESIKTQSGCAP